LVASQRHTLPSDTMKLPWFDISGGIRKFGTRRLPAGPSQ
jgi:hypothetical protein